MSLITALTVAITDYETTFGRPPQVIQIPRWRKEELEHGIVMTGNYMPMTASEYKFMGISLFFSNSDLIELS